MQHEFVLKPAYTDQRCFQVFKAIKPEIHDLGLNMDAKTGKREE
jgi:hypothetical protein